MSTMFLNICMTFTALMSSAEIESSNKFLDRHYDPTLILNLGTFRLEFER